MPIVNFTEPVFLIAAVVLFVLCLYLAKNNKTNTVPCIMLFCFLALLVGHTIELVNTSYSVSTLATCIVVDEAFVFVSFLSFLWLDRIQVEEKKKQSKGKKSSKKGTKEKFDDKVIEDDGLDILWKKV